ncbi:anaerobic ribonucleoside-triphosphate reductase activating protein [Clostridiaceae bacterium]|nr:anaerobic ribonucleoside-triphosphate reductase activating protein [Clostridiaceae bacterium]RKI18309.1 anaerobic ribonucleoside-triphosphate reductase activating protein [bacterium 1XD21-70]
MNYATIKPTDVANGPGVRVTLFVSGCTHGCKGCFNSEAWDFGYGQEFTDQTQEELLRLLSPEYIVGLTLLGGEPMEPPNQAGLLPFIKKVRGQFPQKTIWCFTGYDFEKDIMGKMFPASEVTRELVPLFDVMVDGKFVEEKKNLRLKFRGSENQRILDVKRSLAAGAAAWCEEFR